MAQVLRQRGTRSGWVPERSCSSVASEADGIRSYELYYCLLGFLAWGKAHWDLEIHWKCQKSQTYCVDNKDLIAITHDVTPAKEFSTCFPRTILTQKIPDQN